MWDLTDARRLGTLRIQDPEDKAVTTFSVANRGNLLIYGTDNGHIGVWDLQDARLAGRISLLTPQDDPVYQPVRGVVFSRDDTMVGAAIGARIMVFSVANWQLTRTIEPEAKAYSRSVWSLSFDPRGSRIGLGWTDGTVEVWDLQSGTRSAEYSVFRGRRKVIDWISRYRRNG